MDLPLVEVDSVVAIITKEVEGAVEVREAGVAKEGATITSEAEEAHEVAPIIVKISTPIPRIMQLTKTGKLSIVCVRLCS